MYSPRWVGNAYMLQASRSEQADVEELLSLISSAQDSQGAGSNTGVGGVRISSSGYWIICSLLFFSVDPVSVAQRSVA